MDYRHGAHSVFEIHLHFLCGPQELGTMLPRHDFRLVLMPFPPEISPVVE